MTDNTLHVLYEDNHLLILNKPGGLLTQPSGTNQNSLEKMAKEWLKHKYQKPGNVFLEAVHRLDKSVSGIVVFGKTSKALARLNASMRGKEAHKFYYAVVEGSMPSPEGVLEHYLVHDDYKASISSPKNPLAKLARLTYKTLKQNQGISHLEIELETGRYHQIRVQCAAVGCPILGDIKYGSRYPLGDETIALHHWRLEMPHPVTKEIMTIHSPLPNKFKELQVLFQE